jgi:hypothetical protein
MLQLFEVIIESERTRSDFLKWKLIGVAALGSAGLGLNQASGVVHAYFLLLLIPPVCFYVDLLCRHISVRVLIIAAFMRQQGTYDERRYENFIKEKARSEGFLRWEDTALEWSTFFLSVSIVIIGFFPKILSEVTSQPPQPFWIPALFAGFGGILAAGGLGLAYRCRANRLDDDQATAESAGNDCRKASNFCSRLIRTAWKFVCPRRASRARSVTVSATGESRLADG